MTHLFSVPSVSPLSAVLQVLYHLLLQTCKRCLASRRHVFCSFSLLEAKHVQHLHVSTCELWQHEQPRMAVDTYLKPLHIVGDCPTIKAHKRSRSAMTEAAPASRMQWHDTAPACLQRPLLVCLHCSKQHMPQHVCASP